jgi:Zn-finger nucleic acid-binding protein
MDPSRGEDMTAEPLLYHCPKCGTPMRSVERSGVTIETCPDCRGIFLDRGELDRLLDLEAEVVAGRTVRGDDRRRGERGYDREDDRGWARDSAPWDRAPRRWDADDDDDRRAGRRRRGGFLGELLDFGD